jgi:transposase
MRRHLHTSHGAAESFVSFIDEMDSSNDSIGIDVPESLLVEARRSPSVQNDTLVAVDIAKEVFEVGISDRPGRVAFRRRPQRREFLELFAQLPQATVVMEACGSAHHWARKIEELGHVVVLLPPQYVRPYVLRNKTDRTDVDALLEAFRNEQIRPVPIKTVTQQVIATLHRLRSGWLSDRVRGINSLRGLLRELGFFIPEGRKHVLPDAWEIIQDPERGLPDALRPSLAALCEEIASLSTRIEAVEAQLEALARQIPMVARLRSVPGIGLLSATALFAFVGDISRFPSARHLSSFIGLTPREHSSGLRRHLGRISKRGDSYLRMLLIHGARSVLWHSKRMKHPDRLRSWALRLERKLGHNKAAVALANKLARVTWAVWRSDRDFEPLPDTQAA